MEIFKEKMRLTAVEVANTSGRNKPVSHATKWGGKDLSLREIRNIVEKGENTTDNMTYAQRNAVFAKELDSDNVMEVDEFDDVDYDQITTDTGQKVYEKKNKKKTKNCYWWKLFI